MSEGGNAHLAETVMSYISGLIYAVGFWIWVDGTTIGVKENLAYASGSEIDITDSDYIVPKEVHVEWYHWFPLIVGTIALFLINIPPHNYIFDNDESSILGDDNIRTKVNVWLLVSFIIAFASIIMAVWMSVAHLLKDEVTNQWPGVSLIVSTILIFISALFYRFQRAFEKQDDGLGM